MVELIPGEPPRVKVTGRTSYYLSAFGEHLSGREIEAAVLAAAHDAGHSVNEYTVAPIYPECGASAGQHLFVVELDAPAGDEARFADVLDRALQEGNEDYEVHRRGDFQLKPPRVVLVAPGRSRTGCARVESSADRTRFRAWRRRKTFVEML